MAETEIAAQVDASHARLPILATVVVTMTTIVSHSFGRSTYGLLLPAIEDGLDLSHSRAGVGGTVIFAAYFVGVLTVTIAAARVEPVTIMRIGLGVAACGLMLLAVTPGFVPLLIGLGLAGGAGAGVWISAPATATATVPAARRGLVIGFLSASIGLGTFAVGTGTSVVRSLTDSPGLWRPIWAAEACFTLVLLAAMVLFVRPAPTKALGGGLSLDLLRTVPGWLHLTLGYSCYGIVAAGFAPFLVEALEQDAGLSRTTATTVFAVMGLGAVPMAPLLGLLSDRWGRKRPMIAVLAVVIVGCGFVALGTGVVVAIAVVIFGAAWSSFPILTATFVRDHAEGRQFGSAFGTMTVFYSLSTIGAPVVVGALADSTGDFTLSYLVLAAVGLAGVVFLVQLPTDRH